MRFEVPRVERVVGERVVVSQRHSFTASQLHSFHVRRVESDGGLTASQLHSFCTAHSFTAYCVTAYSFTAYSFTAHCVTAHCFTAHCVTAYSFTAYSITVSQLYRFPRRSLSTCSHALARLPGTFFGPGHTSLMIPDLPHSKRLMSIFALNFGPLRKESRKKEEEKKKGK